MLVDVDIDECIPKELKDHILILESSTLPMWFFDDKEKDRAAVNHLIHCMKVVADYYSNWDDSKFFDYSSASR